MYRNLIALVLCASACGRQVTNASSDAGCKNGESVIVAGRSAGGVRLGDSAAALHSVCRVIRDTADMGAEGIPRRILVVGIGSSDSVTAYIDDNTVTSIGVTDPAVRSADSLAAGMPIARLFSQGDLTGIEVESELFVTIRARCGMSFLLDYDIPDSLHHPEWTRAELMSVPAVHRVKEIEVFRCPRT